MTSATFEPDMISRIIERYPGFTWPDAEYINPETFRREGIDKAVSEAWKNRNLNLTVHSAIRGATVSELRRALNEEMPRPPKPNTSGLSRKEKERVMDAYYRMVAQAERRRELYWRRPIWMALHPGSKEEDWRASEARRRASEARRRATATAKRSGGGRHRKTHRLH